MYTGILLRTTVFITIVLVFIFLPYYLPVWDFVIKPPGNENIIEASLFERWLFGGLLLIVNSFIWVVIVGILYILWIAASDIKDWILKG